MIALGPCEGPAQDQMRDTLTLAYPDIVFFGLKDVKDVFQWFLVPRHIIFPGEYMSFAFKSPMFHRFSTFIVFLSFQPPDTKCRFRGEEKIHKKYPDQFLRHMKLGYPDMFPIKPDFDGFSIWNWSISAPVSALTSPSCPKNCAGDFVVVSFIHRKYAEKTFFKWWRTTFKWRYHQYNVQQARNQEMGMGQNPIPLVNIKIAGKWMFIPLKMVCIGIDP